MTNKILSFLSVPVFLLALTGCQDDFPDRVSLSDDGISFSTSFSEQWQEANTRSGVRRHGEYLGGTQSGHLGNDQVYVHTILNEDAGKKALTRGMPVTNSNLENFTVFAHAYDNGDKLNFGGTSGLPNLMRDVTVYPDESRATWRSEHDYFWPNDYDYVRFLGHNSATGVNFTISNGLLKLSNYSVSEDVTKQPDLIVACEDVDAQTYRKSKKSVKMNFHHIMTAVRFRTAAGDKAIGNFWIKSVGFNNVINKGTFTMSEFHSDTGLTTEASVENGKMWNYGGTTQSTSNFTIDIDRRVAPGSAVTRGETTLMMIPQEFKSPNNTVTIVLSDGTNEYSVTKSLQDTAWRMGETVTYVISTQSILIEEVLQLYSVERKSGTGAIVGTPEELTDGQKFTVPYYNYNVYDSTEVKMTSHFGVRSLRTTYLEGHEPVSEYLGWTSSGNPSWIQYSNTSGSGSELDPFSINVEAQEMVRTDAWTNLLRTKLRQEDVYPPGARDENGYYDLSYRMNGKRTTANCYIVNAPGKYKIPAVYGNTIVDNNVNLEACGYFSDEDGAVDDEPIYRFVDADGNTIGRFANEGQFDGKYHDVRVQGATTAELIWCDNRRMVETLANTITKSNPPDGGLENLHEVVGLPMTAEGIRPVKYLYFEISEDEIEQGNFTIGLRRATQDYYLWSWHIWITPFVAGDKSINESNGILSPTDLRGADLSKVYTLEPYNLGWCDRVHLEFGKEERTETITFTQDKTGNTITLEIVQPTAEDWQFGNNLLFQWGRKDPFRGSYIFGKAKPILKPFFKYDKGEVVKYGISPTPRSVSVKEALQEPDQVFTGTQTEDANWCDQQLDYLWYATAPASTVTSSGKTRKFVQKYDGKTVYDPSPVGFQVPHIDTFAGITRNGIWTLDPVIGAEVTNYLGNKLYFPVSAYRDLEGALQKGGQAAYYHTGPASSRLVHGMYLNIDDIQYAIANGIGVNADNLKDLMISRVICGAVRPMKK